MASEAAGRVMLVQFAGDYRDAWRRQQEGAGETYYGHGYVLEQLARFARTAGEAAILCCHAPEPYSQPIGDGVTLMASPGDPSRNAGQILEVIRAWDPTHLVVLGPMPAIIRWGLGADRRVLCVMADSFNTGPLRRFLRYGRLATLLNRPGVEWVANHGRNACESLARIGVDRGKVIPWDWPHRRHPDQLPPRQAPADDVPTLAYVGLIHRSKGIGDAIDAIAELRRRGRAVRLRAAGGGDVDGFRARAARRGVSDLVEFLGVIPNDRVFALMRESTAVLVPSRPAYPEGLPLTIYEALCARTPIVASDHPMFSGILTDGETARVFPAGRPARLADAVASLLDDPALYAELSRRAPETWQRLQQPVLWGDLIGRWLNGGNGDREWLRSHSLSRLPSA